MHLLYSCSSSATLLQAPACGLQTLLFLGLCELSNSSLRVHVPKYYVLGPQGTYIGTTLRPKYTYISYLGAWTFKSWLQPQQVLDSRGNKVCSWNGSCVCSCLEMPVHFRLCGVGELLKSLDSEACCLGGAGILWPDCLVTSAGFGGGGGI